jgi:hypothetical protein
LSGAWSKPVFIWLRMWKKRFTKAWSMIIGRGNYISSRYLEKWTFLHRDVFSSWQL